MYEVEIKAVVSDRDRLIELLHHHTILSENAVVYEDIYMIPDDTFVTGERELRIRRVSHATTGEVETILTYKDPPFDQLTKFKPEYETQVADFDTCVLIFKKLGFVEDIHLEKSCQNYTVEYQGSIIEVTLAQLPELAKDYIEVECPTSDLDSTEPLFRLLREFLGTVGIVESDYTSEYYTDVVRKWRDNNPSST